MPADLETRVAMMEEKVQKHEDILRGEDGMSGLLASTIRLQEQMKNATKLLWVVLGSVVVLAIEAVVGLLGKLG